MSKDNTNLNLTPSFKLFDKSYALIKKNFRIFAILYILPVLFSLTNLASSNGTIKTDSTDFHMPIVFWFLIPIASLFVLWLIIVYQTMITLLELKVTNSDTVVEFKQLFKDSRPYWAKLFGLGLLVGLSVVVGLILFIVPGLIMIRRYYLAAYFMMDKNLGIREAMRQSAAASKNVSGYIWGLLGVTFVLGLAGIIPLIGSLISTLLTAAYSVAPALRYQEIKNLATSGDK